MDINIKREWFCTLVYFKVALFSYLSANLPIKTILALWIQSIDNLIWTMSNSEPSYTVFIRLPFPRGDFVDPPAVSKSSANL
jgi:hypothetical protein